MRASTPKTYYSRSEYVEAIRSKVPNLSGWTLMQIEKLLNIKRIYAGTQPLYSADELERVLAWLQEADKRSRLALRDGFLVAPEIE